MGFLKSSRLPKFRAKKDLNTPLTLTSLVDAFSILVIFLIVSGSNPSNFKKQQNIQLPQIKQSEKITSSLKISILGNQYFLDNKKVSPSELMSGIKSLAEVQKNSKAILEADKNTNFEFIEPVMKILSDLDIETVHLAVKTKRVI